MLRETLSFIAYSDFFKFVPWVDWDNDGLYSDKDSVALARNPFEYFFKNIGNFNEDEVSNSKLVVNAKFQDAFWISKETYSVDDQEILTLSKVYSKYIHLNTRGISEIEKYVNDVISQGSIIGVHVRATDFLENYNGHPVAVTIEEYLDAVNRIILDYKYDKIYVATDDSSVIGRFKEEFGDKVIYSSALRSKDGKPVHTNEKLTRKNNGYLMALEVLRDVYVLANASFLIAGQSNVSIMARIINASLREQYKDMIIIDKGVNRNKKDYFFVNKELKRK